MNKRKIVNVKHTRLEGLGKDWVMLVADTSWYMAGSESGVDEGSTFGTEDCYFKWGPPQVMPRWAKDEEKKDS